MSFSRPDRQVFKGKKASYPASIAEWFRADRVTPPLAEQPPYAKLMLMLSKHQVRVFVLLYCCIVVFLFSCTSRKSLYSSRMLTSGWRDPIRNAHHQVRPVHVQSAPPRADCGGERAVLSAAAQADAGARRAAGRHLGMLGSHCLLFTSFLYLLHFNSWSRCASVGKAKFL